jgi:hypothetical protein
MIATSHTAFASLGSGVASASGFTRANVGDPLTREQVRQSRARGGFGAAASQEGLTAA